MAPRRSEPLLLGLDLDNTIVDYALAYLAIAREFDLPEHCTTRQSIRGELRRSAHDDEEWQRFQTELYTVGLDRAQPAEGLMALLHTCRDAGVPVIIVSHKTAFGPARFGRRDLHAPALAWLERTGIAPGLVPLESVSFHESVEEKIGSISAQSPGMFVDDLREVLEQPGFPVQVERVLYTAGAAWSREPAGIWTAGFESINAWVASC